MAAKKHPAKSAKAAKKVPTKAVPVKKPATKKGPLKTATAKTPAQKAPAKKTAAKAATVKKTASPKAKPKQAGSAKPAVKVVPAAKTRLDKPATPKQVVRKSGATQSPRTTDTAPAAPVKSPHPTAFVQKQHQRLLDLRDELVDAMSGMTRDTIRNAPEGSEASGSGMHQGDAGSDAYDRDFALSVLAKEQDALYEIEQALRRIKQGSYGVCELSGEKIPQPRLEAIPFARLTVQCQAQWEKDYGNRRFRPSNEVGFSGGNTFDDEDSESVLLDEDDE